MRQNDELHVHEKKFQIASERPPSAQFLRGGGRFLSVVRPGRTIKRKEKLTSSVLNSCLFLYAGLDFPLISSPFATMSRGASRTSPPRRAEVAAVLSAEYSSTFRKVLFRSPPCVHPFAVAACRAWRPPYVGSARLPLSHRSRMSWFQIFVPSRCDAGRKHGFASPGSPNSFQNGKKQEKDE